MNQRRGMVCLAVKQNLLKHQWKWQHRNFFIHNLICFISLLQSWTQIFLCREVGNACSFIHSFIPLACAECDDSLPFSGASSILLCYIPFPSTLIHQLVFDPPSLHLAICFMVYLSALFPNLCIVLFWEFYFLPFSVHVQTNVSYLTLLSIL